MLDLNFIRNNPEKVKKAAADKHENANAHIDKLLELDAERRRFQYECEQLRNKRNVVSKQIGEMQKKKQDASQIINEMRLVSDSIKEYEEKLKTLSPEIEHLILRIPNIPVEDVPVGADAASNIEVKSWGEKKPFNFQPLPHWELGAILNILDFERASKVTGTGFTLFKGTGARLERALYNFMLDLHTREHGYQEVSPPFLVNRASMIGTGQLPKLEEDMYRTSEDDLFLIPTAEVPVTNIHRDEILSYKELPIYYTAYTPCFRREAGSYGKDTRGMIRVHQFDKVELVKFVRPETSYDELESLLLAAEKVLQLLGLHYRVLKLCTGDMSFAAAKCYDIEAWAPGVGRYLEVSSCSNFEDFQARRTNIRFRDEDGKIKYVHTLNGSGVALARTIIAILETYQRQDGSIEIPEVLQPYMGGLKVIEKK
ncbi:MAG TPA: serine--tRNA ligase [Candidatus Brocadiia bacterium]|nr:serine--tRNA ligase [Candidatus Brocadiales bacterium]